MGCTASKQMEEKRPSSNIYDPLYRARQADKYITEAIERSKKLKKQKKILLLGAGESGKSTVLKQLKILHKNGFTNEERKKYTQIIWSDVVNCMCTLIMQARKNKIPLDCDNYINEPSNLPLKNAKDTLLTYRKNILSNLDITVAGGEKFLSDYLMKYGNNSDFQRKKSSTGKIEGFTHETEIDSKVFEDSENENMDIDDENTLNNRQEYNNGSEESLNDEKTYTSLLAQDDIIKLNGDTSGILQLNRGKNNKNNGSWNGEKTRQVTNQPIITREQVGEAIALLWMSDSGIRKIWNKRNEFQIESNANYYFDNVIKFVDENYLCTDADILAARIKTTGIQETQFQINGEDFKILDAGGQRSERKKWLKSFDDITAVLFVLAVSEFDQVLFEDHQVNRMHESMLLFKTLVNSKWFVDTPFILFLNKTDLFEEKIVKHNAIMKNYLPDYTGKIGNVEDGLKYFEKTFLRFNRTKKPVYIHRTCATDGQLMKKVLSTVTDMFIQNNLKATGMM